MPYKLFLTTRQKTKIINAFADKVLSDIKLSQSQLISSDEFLSKILGNMIYIIPIDLAVPLTQDVLPKLVTKEIFSVSNKFEIKISRRVTVRSKKIFTLFISNEDMDHIIKIVKAL